MIRWFDDFLALAEFKQFSSAADNTYISESALSKRIKKLENEIGVPLFSRSNSKVELTKAGEIFLEYSLKVRELTNNLENTLEEFYHSPEAVCITVASIPYITEYGIMHELFEFEKHNPKYRFDCFETVQADCIRGLEWQKVDVAVCRSDFLSSEEYDVVQLIRDHMVLVCRKDLFSFKNDVEVDLREPELEKQCFYTFVPKESDIYRLTQKQFQVCGLDEKMYHIERIAHRHMMLLSMVNEEGGCALLPEKVADIRLFPNLTYYHLKNALPTVISLVRLRGKICTDPLFQYFIDKKKQGRI